MGGLKAGQILKQKVCSYYFGDIVSHDFGAFLED